MSEKISLVQDLLREHLKSDEEIIFSAPIPRLVGRSDLWVLTDQRLLLIGKKGLVEKKLFNPGEKAVFHESGEGEFSGNVHLLTNQRVLVLDIGANAYLLESIPLSKITDVDVDVIREGWINSIIYGLRISIEDDRPIMIKHGRVTTSAVDKKEIDLIKRQQINERFPRKICEVAGMGFAVPHKSIGKGGMTIVDFYSKSDLEWPANCSACYVNVTGLVYDEYVVENPWLTAGYSLGFGLKPQFTYQIPYCSECFNERFGFVKNYRAVIAGWAQSNGARVELCFENQSYMLEFIHSNSS